MTNITDIVDFHEVPADWVGEKIVLTEWQRDILGKLVKGEVERSYFETPRGNGKTMFAMMFGQVIKTES